MITQAQYAWHHVNTYDITSTLYDITLRYDIHIHCIHVITPRIPVVASTVDELLLTVYWLEHVCNMCDIKPLYVWHHMNSMLYYSLFYWHPKLYSWHNIHNIPEYRADCIGHNIHYTCDTTATVTMTRHCNVFDMILSVYEISHAEWMTTQPLYLTWYPMYLCNQTHFTNDITPYVRMKQHSLHAWHHSYFTWHHIHACWQHTIVSKSWHKLCLWHHMYYIWCHPYCVYD